MGRRGAAVSLGVLALACAGGSAYAGAWPTPKGDTQLILKVEDEQGGEGYDPSRNRVAIPYQRQDYLSLFLEHGLTSSLTLQAKASYTSGEDQFVRYSGRGPIELGLHWAAFQRGRTVISFYAGGLYNGVGQNAYYARPDIGHYDGELRALFGQSARIAGHETFVDAEVAHLFRSGGLADENRFDLTAGVYATPKWLVLFQSYSGATDDSVVKSDWVKLEGGVVRHLGPWSLQAGWRGVVYGRETPISSGPVIGVWRRF